MKGYDYEAHAEGRCLLEAVTHELKATMAHEKVRAMPRPFFAGCSDDTLVQAMSCGHVYLAIGLFRTAAVVGSKDGMPFSRIWHVVRWRRRPALCFTRRGSIPPPSSSRGCRNDAFGPGYEGRFRNVRG